MVQREVLFRVTKGDDDTVTYVNHEEANQLTETQLTKNGYWMVFCTRLFYD